ncbi:MAG: S1 RNA-binding domain-containing protein [Chloroflexota bacterium]|nr:S1 RNA-binding domain-containing protein [Chloroflexota bacterium]
MNIPKSDNDTISNMADLLDSVQPIKPIRKGDIVTGVVMSADHDGIFVNIGAKAEGVVPPAEMKTIDSETFNQMTVGDEIVTFVIRTETAEEGAILSVDRAIGEHGWHTIELALGADETVLGKIVGFNRGGAIVEVEGVHGFVPVSQLVSISKTHFQSRDQQDTRETGDGHSSASYDVSETQLGQPESESSESSPSEEEELSAEKAMDADVGKSLQLKVLEVNRSRNRAIFSERQAVQQQRDEQKARLIEDLAEGGRRSGVVTGISNFGAFVDLGGADGLIHISELSWSQVTTPHDVVSVGDEIDVYVLRVDVENKRIALSLKRLQPEPWENITDRHNVDDIVDATVTKLTNFGAFARVEDAVEGLIHISELSTRMITHPKEIVTEGQPVRVKILRIEPERRRLGLSLKQAMDEEGLSPDTSDNSLNGQGNEIQATGLENVELPDPDQESDQDDG